MPREKYKLTIDDGIEAQRWITRKLNSSDDTWPGGENWNEARHDYFDAARLGHETLQAWCDQYLTPQQWTQLRNAIRSQRRRDLNPNAKKSVDLDRDAWRILSDTAGREKCTLSEAVNRIHEAITRSQAEAAERDAGAAAGDPMKEIMLSPMINPSRHDFRVMYRGFEIGTAKPEDGAWKVFDMKYRAVHSDLKTAIRNFMVSAGVGLRRN